MFEYAGSEQCDLRSIYTVTNAQRIRIFQGKLKSIQVKILPDSYVMSKDDPMMKNVLIWLYFEVGSCKICSTPKRLSGSKMHFCFKILKFIVWIFEICPGVDFVTI